MAKAPDTNAIMKVAERAAKDGGSLQQMPNGKFVVVGKYDVEVTAGSLKEVADFYKALDEAKRKANKMGKSADKSDAFSRRKGDTAPSKAYGR